MELLTSAWRRSARLFLFATLVLIPASVPAAITGQSISLGEAVDNTGLAWTTGSAAPWFGQTNTTHHGGDAAQSGAGASSWIETTVIGPGVLSFYWQVSSFYQLQHLEFAIDGVRRSLCWAQVWEGQIYQVPPGSHRLTWTFNPYNDPFGNARAAFLDKVGFVAGAGPSLGDAVDSPGLVWTVGGPVQWFGQTEMSRADGDAGYVLAYDQDVWLGTTIAGPGLLTFYWQRLEPFPGPHLTFRVDGVERAWYNVGGAAWSAQLHAIAPGDHTLRWVLGPREGWTLAAPASGFLDEVVYLQGPRLLLQTPHPAVALRSRNFASFTWVSTDGVGPLVRLDVYRGDVPRDMISTATDNDGRFEWLIPAALAPGSDYRVRISAVSNPTIFDFSDAFFTIEEDQLAALQGYLVLSSTGAFAETGDHEELDAGGGHGNDLTVEAWINLTSLDEARIVDKGGYRLWASGTATVRCLNGELRLQGAGSPVVEVCHTKAGGGLWSPGWHHVALVYDGIAGRLSLYLDGARTVSQEATGVPAASADLLRLGEGLQGLLDEVRVSHAARYTGDSFALSTQPFACDPVTGALWHLDEPAGATTFHDQCGVDNVLAGQGGAHTEGVIAHRRYIPLIEK